MNIHTGEVKPWASLTEAEKRTGEWVPVTAKDAELLEAGRTQRADVIRQTLAPFNHASGLPIDAKPQAHRRAIRERNQKAGLLDVEPGDVLRAAGGVVTAPAPQLPALPRAQIDTPAPGDVLEAISVAQLLKADLPAFRGESIDESLALEARGIPSARDRIIRAMDPGAGDDEGVLVMVDADGKMTPLGNCSDFVIETDERSPFEPMLEAIGYQRTQGPRIRQGDIEGPFTYVGPERQLGPGRLFRVADPTSQD